MKTAAVSLAYLEIKEDLNPIIASCYECKYCIHVIGFGAACKYVAPEVRASGDCLTYESAIPVKI